MQEKKMRILFSSFLAVIFVVAGLTVLPAQEKKPPKELIFQSKMGNVTFLHAKHVEREKGDCKVCHPALFPQSDAPLNFKAGMHKPAEAKKTSCAFCHRPGGQAFAVQGNCKKCHVKG
jgi:c(7)-type cytochrome triheme protein